MIPLSLSVMLPSSVAKRINFSISAFINIISFVFYTHTLKQITEKIDRPEIDEDIADFYITLGKAGYLQNKVEVKKVSHEFNKV